MARGFPERAYTFRKRGGSCINGLRFFDLGDQGGANDGGVGKAAKNGYMAGQ